MSDSGNPFFSSNFREFVFRYSFVLVGYTCIAIDNIGIAGESPIL